ncbi:MAG: cell envelope biogenesis protein OmpA [Halobacteriovoraceae bacterium]|nr:cell envelope biogenesis protein OmpA [Halobacteriovoraceae bacterium]MBT5093257.1 cell envelope biogenesis protein OmpA [Halobacteriovoraceae bacterium]
MLIGCSSRPVLYPNTRYKERGKSGSKMDIDRCMERADKFIDSPRGKKILKGAGGGSIVGSAMGAIAGIFTGDIIGGIAQGAAMGAAGGAVGASLTPDSLKQAYVNRCLGKKGYEVIGWD